MTLHLGIPAIVAVIGAGLYGFLDGKLGDMGRILFFAGTLATLLALKA